ncbi:MAG: prepilin-type N-terminal cleavage/methylation domain-containing protein [Kiritimatiellia bacterium]
MSTYTQSKSDRNSGFTLIELMFASSLALLLILTLFESIATCRNICNSIKWQLAADEIAFDEAWEIFNRHTEWFETSVPAAQSDWSVVDSQMTSVWHGGQQAYLLRSITPLGMPANRWVIRTNVAWPVGNGNYKALTTDHTIIRYQSDRRIF